MEVFSQGNFPAIQKLYIQVLIARLDKRKHGKPWVKGFYPVQDTAVGGENFPSREVLLHKTI